MTNNESLVDVDSGLISKTCGLAGFGKKTLNRPIKANRVQWYRRILRRHNDGVLKGAVDFGMVKRRQQG